MINIIQRKGRLGDQRQTRFSDELLELPINRTVKYSNSFPLKSLRLFNSFKEEIIDATSEKPFKNSFKMNY